MSARPTLRSTGKPSWGHRVGLAVPLTLVLAGCDLPSELPKWNTTWVVPGENTTISVSRLLPGSVSVAPGGSAFALSLPGVSVSQTLGQMCGAPCSTFQGLIVPKPQFTANLPASIALPTDVISARVTGGTVQVRLEHTFSFDPIRPSPTARGYIVVTATAGSVTLARDSIPGETTAFAPGTALTRNLALATATVAGPISINARIFSPAGDPVMIDTNQRVTVTATPMQIVISEAQVRVANRSITGEQVELDLADIDQAVSERTKAGALLLDLDNPFAVTGTLTLTINGPNANIVKQVPLQQGAQSVRVEFNEQEIQSILGTSPVRLSVSGTVNAPTSGATVRPSQVVTIRSRLLLTLGPKEN